MKTTRMFTVLRLMVLGVLVAGFNLKPASAQTFQGKFTLPSEARWGLATLPAGEYTFTLDTNYPAKFTVGCGTRNVALIPAQRSSHSTSGRSEMALENGTVREVSLPQIGKIFVYPTDNAGHRAAPQAPQVARTIPITAVAVGR